MSRIILLLDCISKVEYSGRVVLCVLPANDLDPLHAVKWHPREPDLVAVASETNVYLVNIADALQAFVGDPIPQAELQRVGQIFSVPSVSRYSYHDM